jgi:uncharacterized protein involved in outer membrane biogenesis
VRAKLKQIVIKTCRSKAAIIAAILIVLYTVTGFFLFPYLIVHFVPGMLSQRLNSEVSLRQVKINPFALTLEAKEFQINEPSGRTIAGFQRLYINFQISSLFRWALSFADVTVDAPSVNVVIDPDGKLNLARLSGQNPATPEDETNRPLRMLLHHMKINQGKIKVTDTRQPIPATVSFYPLNIQGSDISTLPEYEGLYTLTAVSTDGATWQWSGRVALQPLRSEGRLEIKQVPLITPWKFVRSQLNIGSPEGRLSLETRYVIDRGQDTKIVTLADLSVQVMDAGLRIEGAADAFLDLPEINLKAGRLDIIQHRIDDVRLAIRGGDLDLIKGKDGILNLKRLTRGEKKAIPPPEASSSDREAPWAINMSEVGLEGLAIHYTDQSVAPAVSFSTDGAYLAFKAAVTTASPKAQGQIDDFSLTFKQIGLGFADTSPPAVQIGNLAMAGTFNLGTHSASISRLELTDGLVEVIRYHDNTVNLTRLFDTKNPAPVVSDKDPRPEDSDPWHVVVETVLLSEFKTRFIDSTVTPDSPPLDLEKISLTVSRFDGKSPSPFEMNLQVAQGGRFTASGNFTPSGATVEATIMIKDLALPPLQPYLSRIADLTLNYGLFSTRGAFHRIAEGSMTYQGQAEITGLKVIDNSTSENLLGWRQLQTSDIRLNLSPNGLEIDTMKLTGLEGKLVISGDKAVNVVEAFKPKTQPSTEPRSKESAPEASVTSFPVRIGKLNLDKGILDFADLSLRPHFATKIHELRGMIIGISSSPGARTQVELDGRVDQYGSSRIKGEINAFNPRQFTDIAMVFRNLEMTNLTPYSGKFAGRKIDSGKLSLDLQYKIEDSQLLGDNKIVIDSLKLGEKVESPDAVSLPLDLAVALLKDSNGIIDIGFPVSGDLDNPEFQYSPLIWKALVKLLTKMVTAPFRALGALVGDGKEILNAVNFEPGSRDVPPPEQEKLFKLIEALKRRPQLKLIVTGRYHNPSDGQVIRQLKVRRALAEKSGMPLKPGEDPGPVDFSNPDSRQKLTELFIKRYGQEAYRALRLEMTPPSKSADAKKKPEDPGELSKLMFSEMIKREPVAPNLLKQLADDRAQAIVRQLSGPDGIPAERIIVQPSGSADTGDPVSCTLGLDAMAPESKG